MRDEDEDEDEDVDVDVDILGILGPVADATNAA